MTYDPFDPLVTIYHVPSFEDATPGYARCVECGAPVTIEGFLSENCPGRAGRFEASARRA